MWVDEKDRVEEQGGWVLLSPGWPGEKRNAKASNISDVYPPLWKESPGQFSDYKIENGKYIINFWHYPERLGTYKILLNKTAKYFAKFSPENEQNILWGLPVHHGWQYHTGRLADPTQHTDCGHNSGDRLCISVDSWWHVKSHSSSFDELLEYLWAAHVSSLKVARKIFQNRLKYYSKQEADFERSWALFVDYLAPPNFPTTLIRTYEFQKELPTRMLVSGDRAPFISDFSGFQNTVLFALNLLHKVHKYTEDTIFNFMENFNEVTSCKETVSRDYGIHPSLF
ncbi:Protein LEG1 homolog [Vulpes lagopus]